jgi:aspartate dehydrogenase
MQLCLIGFGAIGRAIEQHLRGHAHLRLASVLVREARVPATQTELDALWSTAPGSPQAPRAVATVPADAQWVLECAGHSALQAHVLPTLARGVSCATLSIGSLADASLHADLTRAAETGATQLHLLPGAIGGIDALAAARWHGLDQVQYTGRKPPAAWRGTPAEQLLDLSRVTEPTAFYLGCARQAALDYPKNANVAATVSLAGIGFDRTQVRLMADPTVGKNVHEIEASGTFGRLHLHLEGNPLPDNPKTSALTVLSAIRFLENRIATLTL